MEERNGVSLQDYWALLRRRRFFMSWIFLFVLFSVTLLTLPFPEKYRSTAVIYIEKPQIREDLVRTTVPNYDTDLRIDRITDSVISNSSLAPIIERLSLYPDLPPQARAAQMRADIAVGKIINANDTALGGAEETIGFQVSFKHSSAEKAQLAASRLAHLFVAENAASRTETVMATSDFLDQQADRLKVQLTRTEAALAEFKRQHSGSLPQDSALNEQLLDRSERDLDDVERDIRTAQARKDLLLSQLAQTSPSAPLYDERGQPILGAEDQLESLRRQYVEMSARYSPEHPDLIKLRRAIDLLNQGGSAALDRAAIQAEIETKRAELASLRRRYSEDHPDIARLERTIEALVDQLKSMPSLGEAGPQTRPPDNPAYVQLQVELESTDSDLNALRQDRDKLRNRIDALQAQIALEPETEKELIILTRDYEIARQDYNKIREKQNEAQRAIVVEDEQKAERYVLQRDAGLPSSAAQPTHLTIVLAGVFLAITAAIGAGLLREAVDGTVRGTRDLRLIARAPPMAIVPTMTNGSERWSRRIRAAALAVSCVGVAFAAALVAA